MIESFQIVVVDADEHSLVLGIEQLRDDDNDRSGTVVIIFDCNATRLMVRVRANSTGLGDNRLASLVSGALADVLDDCAVTERKMLATHYAAAIEEKGGIGFQYAVA
jgi:hypothetical protein